MQIEVSGGTGFHADRKANVFFLLISREISGPVPYEKVEVADQASGYFSASSFTRFGAGYITSRASCTAAVDTDTVRLSDGS